MATNVTAYMKDVSKGRYKAALLGTGATATDDGDWIRVDNIDGGTVHIYGGVGSVSLHGSNEDDAPANSDDGAEIQSATATEDAVAIAVPYKWMKAKVTAYTSGTILADYLGTTKRY